MAGLKMMAAAKRRILDYYYLIISLLRYGWGSCQPHVTLFIFSPEGVWSPYLSCSRTSSSPAAHRNRVGLSTSTLVTRSSLSQGPTSFSKMPAVQTPKGFFSAKPAGWKKPGQPGSPNNLDAAEKAQAPQRITAEGPERPKKSCTPQKIAFRTFIQPYKKRYASCKGN